MELLLPLTSRERKENKMKTDRINEAADVIGREWKNSEYVSKH